MKKIILFLSGLFILTSAWGADEQFKGAFQFQDALIKIAENSFPAVVVIKVKVRPQDEIPAVLDEFFGFYHYPGNAKKQGEAIQSGQASGFIVREDGYILTANHVLDAGTEAAVALYDGREFPAKIVGRDRLTDIAILKIDTQDKLPLLKFADSDKLKVGQIAIAIGAPFALDYSMTLGIVSQKGRTAGLNMYENYIQTDAPINPGSSGGPLLNLNGEVIGINDFILSAGPIPALNTGTGFAIPSNMASNVFEQIVKNGEVKRPWLGVAMQQLTPALQNQFKVKSGILIAEVYTGHPADEAGMEAGDIITEVNKNPVRTPIELQNAILNSNAGDQIKLTVFRAGKNLELTVRAGYQKNYVSEKNGRILPAHNHPANTASGMAAYGIKLLDKGSQTYIAAISSGSSAELAGLKSGMRIRTVNGQKVSNADEAEKAAESDRSKITLQLEDEYSRYMIFLQK